MWQGFRQASMATWPATTDVRSLVLQWTMRLTTNQKIAGTVNTLTVPIQRREIIVRGQSYFSRLPKYWPPIPLSARRVCTPRLCCRGRTDSSGGEGDGGSIFWKTREIGLPSYNDLSTPYSIHSIPLSLAPHPPFSSPPLPPPLPPTGTCT